jgi:hypothetical protein
MGEEGLELCGIRAIEGVRVAEKGPIRVGCHLSHCVMVKSIREGSKGCQEHLLHGVHLMRRSRTNQRYSGRSTRGSTRATTTASAASITRMARWTRRMIRPQRGTSR